MFFFVCLLFFVFVPFFSLARGRERRSGHEEVRRRQEDGRDGHDGEGGEDDEADAVDDHCGKLPVGHQLVLVLAPAHLRRDEAQLAHDLLQLALRLRSACKTKQKQKEIMSNESFIQLTASKKSLSKGKAPLALPSPSQL